MGKITNIISLACIIMMAIYAWDGDICWTIYAGFLLMFSISLNGRDK